MKIILIKLIRVLTRLLGNVVKALSYPFHWIFPKKRFTIPNYSSAKIKSYTESLIPKVIWQTNYSNQVTLPVYVNYLFNRLMSLDFEYYYSSHEDREELIKKYGTNEEFKAFSQLTDGASQADFWRLFVLNLKGVVYMDIDAQLVYPLNKIIQPNFEEVICYREINLPDHPPRDYTNYFIASKPDHWLMQDCIAKIVDNIQQRRVEYGVYHLTGPGIFNQSINEETPIHQRLANLTCSQGTFTNEYFQYMDKKRGKWIYAKNDELLK